MRIYYAQKVIVKTVPRSDLSGAVNTHKTNLNNEINKHKVNIDKDVFKKTDKEIDSLKTAKAQFKHNLSEKTKEEILKAFINSPIPRWNISFVLTK